jgi:glucuronoarabinoxylan endo-1,4-beta-xylanase
VRIYRRFKNGYQPMQTKRPQQQQGNTAIIATASIVLALLSAACGGASKQTVGGSSGTSASVTIDWSSVQQTIDGFGGAAVGSVAGLPSNLAEFFFSPSTGIGLSIVRIEVIPDQTTCTALCSGGGYVSPCGCVSSSGPTTLTGELQIAQQAQALGVKTFIASSWSPPASMKSNGSWLSGGSFIGNNSNYSLLASLFAKYVTLVESNGIPLYAFSPQNEPDISQTYQSCTWTAQQFHDFVPYLYNAFQSANVGTTKIMIPEESNWDFSYASMAMGDSTVAPDVRMLAGHGYGVTSPSPPNNYGLHVWMTEDANQGSTYGGSMADALTSAQTIHNYLANANVSAWIWWFLSDMPQYGNGTDNSALTNINGNLPLRAYVTGNWSKFVRPGWHRVGVSNNGSLLVTAFQSADNSDSAIVVVNTGPEVSNQVFDVGTQMATSVVPWITSSTLSLAQQTPVTLTEGSLTYTIPADSVVTFAAQTTN